MLPSSLRISKCNKIFLCIMYRNQEIVEVNRRLLNMQFLAQTIYVMRKEFIAFDHSVSWVGI